MTAAAQPQDRALRALVVALLGVVLASGFVIAERNSDETCPLPIDALVLKINPNTATRDELMLLPGIGPRLADRIVAARDASPNQPAFRTLGDLAKIPRIGGRLLERIAPYLQLSDEQQSSDE